MRKQQTRQTLARGVYWVYTPLHTNGKEKTELQEKFKAGINLLTLYYSGERFFTWLDLDFATGSFKYTLY